MRLMGRGKCEEKKKKKAHDPKQASSVKRGGMACMPASGIESLIFIGDVTAGWILK